jgi:hypothetical protein
MSEWNSLTDPNVPLNANKPGYAEARDARHTMRANAGRRADLKARIKKFLTIIGLIVLAVFSTGLGIRIEAYKQAHKPVIVCDVPKGHDDTSVTTTTTNATEYGKFVTTITHLDCDGVAVDLSSGKYTLTK